MASAKKKSSSSSTSKSAARSTASTKSTGAKKGSAQKGESAFMRPVNIRGPLALIVGEKPIPRTEVTKKVWEYIRKHKLQDQKNKRQINADDKLREVFGGKDQVSMFEMTKLVNQFLS